MMLTLDLRPSGTNNPDFIPSNFKYFERWGWAHIVAEGMLYVYTPQDARRLGLPKDFSRGRVKIDFTYDTVTFRDYLDKREEACWEEIFRDVPYVYLEVL